MKAYLVTLVVVMMAAAVLEMLLPDDEFRRYVRPVVGMVLVLTLMSPLLSADWWENWSIDWPQSQTVSADTQKLYDANLNRTFCAAMEQKIREALQKSGMTANSVTVTADTTGDPPAISSVRVDCSAPRICVTAALVRELSLPPEVIQVES